MNEPVIHRYIVALGSNQRHGIFGPPPRILVRAMASMGALGTVERRSAIHASAPIGPSNRRFANAVVELVTDLAPVDLLSALQRIERGYGRRRGQRWSRRVLDLDILLWERGWFRSPHLTIPHVHLAARRFVLAPAAEIVPGWQDPHSRLTIRHLAYRLTRAKPLDRGPPPL